MVGLFRKTRKDEIDIAAEEILKILKRGAEPIELPERENKRKQVEKDVNIEVFPLKPNEIADFLEPIIGELDQLERTVEEVKPRVKTISRLIPKLEEIQNLLKSDMTIRQEKSKELIILLKEYENQKKSTENNILQKEQRLNHLETEIQKEKKKISIINHEIPKLEQAVQKSKKIANREEADIKKVKDHIERIQNLRRPLRE